MSEQFRQGQLVAVRDSNDCEWKLRIFDHERGGQHYCIDPEHEMSQAVWWAHVCPAEWIWPDAFLSCDREIIDSLQKERDRLHEAIGWLCDRLEEASREHDFCPPNALPDDCDNACWECWQQAVYEAMEGKPCP